MDPEGGATPPSPPSGAWVDRRSAWAWPVSWRVWWLVTAGRADSSNGAMMYLKSSKALLLLGGGVPAVEHHQPPVALAADVERGVGLATLLAAVGARERHDALDPPDEVHPGLPAGLVPGRPVFERRRPVLDRQQLEGLVGRHLAIARFPTKYASSAAARNRSVPSASTAPSARKQGLPASHFGQSWAAV